MFQAPSTASGCRFSAQLTCHTRCLPSATPSHTVYRRPQRQPRPGASVDLAPPATAPPLSAGFPHAAVSGRPFAGGVRPDSLRSPSCTLHVRCSLTPPRPPPSLPPLPSSPTPSTVHLPSLSRALSVSLQVSRPLLCALTLTSYYPPSSAAGPPSQLARSTRINQSSRNPLPFSPSSPNLRTRRNQAKAKPIPSNPPPRLPSSPPGDWFVSFHSFLVLRFPPPGFPFDKSIDSRPRVAIPATGEFAHPPPSTCIASPSLARSLASSSSRRYPVVVRFSSTTPLLPPLLSPAPGLRFQSELTTRRDTKPSSQTGHIRGHPAPLQPSSRKDITSASHATQQQYSRSSRRASSIVRPRLHQQHREEDRARRKAAIVPRKRPSLSPILLTSPPP